MRRAVVAIVSGLGVALSASGCAVPATVAAAGYAMSGFTLMDQGKTVSDVVLSAMLDQDCAMWRIIQDQPICIDAAIDATEFAAILEEPEVELADVTGKAPKSATSN